MHGRALALFIIQHLIPEPPTRVRDSKGAVRLCAAPKPCIARPAGARPKSISSKSIKQEEFLHYQIISSSNYLIILFKTPPKIPRNTHADPANNLTLQPDGNRTPHPSSPRPAHGSLLQFHRFKSSFLLCPEITASSMCLLLAVVQ